MPSRRIAIVETYPVQAGREGTALSMAKRESELARNLRRNELETRCFRTTRSDSPSVLTDDSVDWRFSPIDGGLGSDFDRLTRSEDLLGALRDYAPDVIFVKGVGTSLSEDLLTLKIPIRAAIIGGAFQTRELTRYHLVLTETPAQEAFLRSRIGGRVMTLPKLATREFFDVARAQDATVDLITVGRLIPLKNLEILAQLPSKGYRISICGDGPLRPDLERLLAETGNSVTFAGHLSTPQLAHALANARLLAHPSRSEGLPRAVVEAMAAGTPAVFLEGVIESPHLNSSNSVSASPESFGDQIRLLLDDPARLARMSVASRRTAEREFSVARLEAATQALVEYLLEHERRGLVGSARATARMTARRVIWRLRDLPNEARQRASRGRRLPGRVVRKIRRTGRRA